MPVQPGNTGGALVDERGNVVGVVSAKLSARAALAASGALPENVNYAVKSSYLLILVRVQGETNYPRPGADAPHAISIQGQPWQAGLQSSHHPGHV